MNSGQQTPMPEIFYRAVSEDELLRIQQQSGKLVLESAELFITQNLGWVERYARTSRAGRYDYILEITTQPSTIEWIFSVGRRHNSPAAASRFIGRPILKSGDENSVHLKSQRGVSTYGLRRGTIDSFNQRIQRISILSTLNALNQNHQHL